MKNNLIIAVVIIILVALGATGIYLAWQGKKTQTSATASPIPSPISNFPSSENQQSPNPSPSIQPQAGEDTDSVHLGIEITSPSDKSQISSPVRVKGLANVPQELIVVEIKDANGKVLGQTQASACFDAQPCPFEATIVFDGTAADYGTIEANSTQSRLSDSVQIFF